MRGGDALPLKPMHRLCTELHHSLKLRFCWAVPADAGLDNMLRLRTAPAALRGTSAVEVLSGVHERAGAALRLPADPAKSPAPPIAAMLGRLQSRAVARAAEVVVASAGDEDDLFYESGGAATQQLLAALVWPQRRSCRSGRDAGITGHALRFFCICFAGAVDQALRVHVPCLHRVQTGCEQKGFRNPTHLRACQPLSVDVRFPALQTERIKEHSSHMRPFHWLSYASHCARPTGECSRRSLRR